MEVQSPSAPAAPANTSGQGASAIVPDEIKGWNWGAFWLHWIWSIGNQVWIGLLTLLIGIVMQIILGIKGNEWAWQNRRWESVEQFKQVQRTWAIWGWVIFAILMVIVVISIVAAIIAGMAASTQGMGSY
jgi:hypothetical protein